MTDLTEMIEKLRSIDEQLRDLAYDSLRAAADGDEEAKAHEKRLLKARRAVERAIHALEPPEGLLDS
ncbi:MAG TPA: hypothetical protein VFF40_08165 [Acidimicrobiia bacterium]|nr:hypothetical protein [Acidimicrobiia bacterium]